MVILLFLWKIRSDFSEKQFWYISASLLTAELCLQVSYLSTFVLHKLSYKKIFLLIEAILPSCLFIVLSTVAYIIHNVYIINIHYILSHPELHISSFLLWMLRAPYMPQLDRLTYVTHTLLSPATRQCSVLARHCNEDHSFWES